MAEEVKYSFRIVGIEGISQAEVNVKNLTQALNANTKQQQTTNKNTSEGQRKVQALGEEYVRNRKALEQAKAERNKLNKTLKLEAERNATVAGSIGRVNAQLKLEKDRIQGVVIGSAKFKQTSARIKDLENKQRLFNQQLGRTGGLTKATSQGFKQGFAQVGLAVAGALAAFRGLNRLIGGSIDAYAKQEAAQRGLSTALGFTSTALENQAAALQKVSKFGDEEIIQGQAFLAQLGLQEGQIKKITPAILDFASAKGIDLKTASDLVAKSVGSETNALSRYGIQIEGAAGSDERLESALNSLNGAFEGQAEALANVDGGLTQLSNNIGDTQEQFGRFISVLLNELIPGLNETLGTVNSYNDALLDGLEAGEEWIEISARIALQNESFANSVDIATEALISQNKSFEDLKDVALKIAEERGEEEAVVFVNAVKKRLAEQAEAEKIAQEKAKEEALKAQERQGEAVQKQAEADAKKLVSIKNEIALNGLETGQEKELLKLSQRYEIEKEANIENKDILLALEEKYQQDKENIILRFQEKEDERKQDRLQLEQEEKQAKLDELVEANLLDAEQTQAKLEAELELKKEFALNTAQQLSDLAFTLQQQSNERQLKEQTKQNKAEENSKLASLKRRFEAGLITEDEYNKGSERLKAEAAQKQYKSERDAFERQKKLQAAQIGINAASAAISILALSPDPLKPVGPLVLTQLAALGVSTAAQLAILGQQTFADGGFTGSGGKKDSTGHKVAGVVHANEYVAPEWMVNSMPSLFSDLENMRLRPFADGGFTSPRQNIQPVQNIDFARQMRNIRVVNVATDTTGLANHVLNEETADNF